MTARAPARVATALLVALATAFGLAGSTQPSGGVPTPESVLGFAPCADRKVATYEQIVEYFRALDAASDRLRLFDIGRTVEGRTQIMAVISSEANLRALDTWKTTARRLALARDLTDDQARQLSRAGRAVVWIDFGLHSSELAHAQTAPWLAHDVVARETDEMRFIRDNVILLLVPNMNPDGTTLWADWYMKHVGTPFERSSPPELYHRYVGHDNNRDWFMFNMPESRNVARQLYEEWFPQIVYNQHQEGPFPARIFIPPFADPMNPNIPALVARGINLVGSAMGRRFAQEGKSGAVSGVVFDAWWNGGMRTAPYFHNMVGILTETGHRSPAPAVYDPATFPKTFSNGVSTLEPSTFYPDPYRGGQWRFRDSCDYMVTASMAVLDVGAKRRQEWLYDIYQMGRDAIRAGADETYVVPAEQWDAPTATKMVNVLRLGAVDVERATGPFQAGGRQYPAGSFLIRGAQPFRPYLTDLLNPQVYPDRRLYPDGPPARPYDITGWTLPMQMGVTVHRVAERITAPTEPVSTAAPPRVPAPREAGFGYALDPRSNDAFIAVNRLLKAGDTVHRATTALALGDATWPPGAFLVHQGPETHERLAQVVKDLGVRAVGLDAAPGVETVPVRAPRIGLYHAWGGNMDEGWTRWVLEQFEFPFALVHDADVRAGRLRQAFDVIVLPDATYEDMLGGLAPGTMPAEYTGGMSPRGVANLHAFAAEGGTIVAIDGATSLPLTAFGLPVRDVTAGQRPADFYVPGTLVGVTVDGTHPVAYGLPSDLAGFFVHSSAFAVGRPRTRAEEQAAEPVSSPPGVRIVARYADKDLLRSGWLLGERILAGRAAVLEAAVERGRVILVGFRSQHRGQSHGTFKFLFNSLYLAGTEPASASLRLPGRNGP